LLSDRGERNLELAHRKTSQKGKKAALLVCRSDNRRRNAEEFVHHLADRETANL
jgi:hypothetical protein